jgi:hypothetical protein
MLDVNSDAHGMGRNSKRTFPQIENALPNAELGEFGLEVWRELREDEEE